MNKELCIEGTAMTAKETPTGQSPAVVDRMNVALVAEAAEALENLQTRTKMKKVDIANRALRLYEYIDAEMRAGNRVLIRDADGRDYILKLLF